MLQWVAHLFSRGWLKCGGCKSGNKSQLENQSQLTSDSLKILAQTKMAKRHTCIAAEETALPSMDTTPCKGPTYLLLTT